MLPPALSPGVRIAKRHKPAVRAAGAAMALLGHRKKAAVVQDKHMSPPLLDVVRDNSTLVLNVDAPSWADARGYLFDPTSEVLYFKVDTKNLRDRDLEQYRVLIWSTPRIVVTGTLEDGTTHAHMQAAVALARASGRFTSDQVNYMFFDQRSHKPRKNNYALKVVELERFDQGA